MAVTQVAVFESAPYLPGNAAGRTDIQAQVNAFLQTLNPLDVLDVSIRFCAVEKYDSAVMWYGHVTYRQT